MRNYLIVTGKHPRDNNNLIEEKINELGETFKITDSVFILKTDRASKHTRDSLLPYLHEDSDLFVIRVFIECAWYNMLYSGDDLEEFLARSS